MKKFEKWKAIPVGALKFSDFGTEENGMVEGKERKKVENDDIK